MKKTILLSAVIALALIGTGCNPGEEEKDKGENKNNDSKPVVMKEVVDDPNFITHAEAVKKVNGSNTIAKILAESPKSLDDVTYYTSLKVEKLGEANITFPLNQTVYDFYTANQELPVWQVLIACDSDCDEAAFLDLLNVHSPAIPGEGVHETNSDFIFVVSAENGEIVLFERGPGSDPTHPTFVEGWSEFKG